MKIFQVTQNGLNEIERKPDAGSTAIIVDEDAKKIWIWRGSGSSPSDVYKASTLAISLRREFKMFNAKPIIVEEGNEPSELKFK
ncbi:MAG: hypothetical protein OdinLCB4_001260 [Candidatus Odinarchaeum yellowstonii]|uniref:Gelsolin-like domain-containing protein n=1 Tax=Odinarchaeota yellowstonii (strain LCB_4) TaxID=1841599 RepID=A0AAF0D2Q2_ODILC|nr:MAG: hypothetical protein OdinLCB4_001260 [Candidatus Odinarchaeum yellowstonii]